MCIRSKAVVFCKSGCVRLMWMYSASGCIRAKVFVVGQSVCIRAKLLYSGKNGCIRAKFLY